MITGRQIREARKLLGWNMSDLAGLTKVPVEIIERAESVDGTPSITLAQAARIQASCKAVGIYFGKNGAVMRST